MHEPTWYNQDGAVRTLFAIYNNATMNPEAFQAWSLKVFLWILVFDFFRVLIWMDHMGLRVATLVNLSFIGLDRLDEKIARFIGPSAAQRYIPEAVKRFCTWGPLLIPFYIPGGKAWDYVWNTSIAMRSARAGGGIHALLGSLSMPEKLFFAILGILACTGISRAIRIINRKTSKKREKVYELHNREYKVVVKENGEAYSEVTHKEIDVSRRAYDTIDPCGRILYLLDTAQEVGSDMRYWPVVGNFPREKFETSRIQKSDDALKIINTSNGVRTTVDISLPDSDATLELWNIKVENLTHKVRKLKVVPYMEWVLNGPLHDRFHTQYSRLFPEMSYVSKANAVLAWQKKNKAMGILASDIVPEGFLTSRMDFIGRAQSIWKPRIFDTLDFTKAQNADQYPTFDPIGSLIVNASVPPKTSKTIRLLVGCAGDKKKATDMVKKYLKPKLAEDTTSRVPRKLAIALSSVT